MGRGALKKIFALLLLLFCIILVIFSRSSLISVPELQNSLQQPDEYEQNGLPVIPSPQPAQPAVVLNPIEANEEEDDMVYEAGTYKVGTDIPVGIFMATNDGSPVSRITLKNSLQPNIEEPKIIVTARYLPGSAMFSDRSIYANAVSVGGGVPVMPSDDADFAKLLSEGLTENAQVLAERYDGLLLTGGGDIAAHFFNQEHHPASYRPDETLDIAELALTHAFILAKKPVFGVCRGMQVINVAMGGDLIQDIPDLLGLDPRLHLDYEARHPINVRTGSWLYEMFGPIMETTTTHHQCLGVVAPGFSVVARLGPVIEAVESGNILGVQFHPERMLDEGIIPLFEDFIKRCSYSFIEVRVFSKHVIIELEESRYVEITGANLQRVEQTFGLFETDDYYGEGMYLAGHHLPEGEYRLAVTDDSGFSYYAVYDDFAKESSLYSGMIPEEGINIKLIEGQLIELIYATMTSVLTVE